VIRRRVARSVSTVCVLLLASAPLLVRAETALTRPAPTSIGFPLPRKVATQKGIDRTGTFKLTVSLLLNGTISNGTSVTAYATLTTDDATFQSASIRSASANAKSGVVSIVFEVPYDWQVSSTTDKVMMSISVSAAPIVGTGTYSFNNTFNKTMALPANGAVTPVHVAGTL
jgi:hypothetical protein